MTMRFSIITLFPECIQSYCTTSIVGRAQQAGLVQVQTINPRDFTQDPHRKVDDTPYGGGPGMVLQCQPLMDTYESLLPLPAQSRVLLTSPAGRPFDQQYAQSLADAEHIVILCGHYEGIDARVEALIPNLERVSIGDFILTGGELAALCIVDATTRLVPGALGKDASTHEESFATGLLEYPHYTRPPVFRGLEVPAILLSGNHAEIARWRHQQSLARTWQLRPDLLRHADLSEADKQFLRENTQNRDVIPAQAGIQELKPDWMTRFPPARE